jgi:hypothetical protein
MSISLIRCLHSPYTFSGFVALANEFLEKCSIKTKVYKLTDCKDEFFVAVYKGLIGDDLKGTVQL